jgi:hypothetical protein
MNNYHEDLSLFEMEEHFRDLNNIDEINKKLLECFYECIDSNE